MSVLAPMPVAVREPGPLRSRLVSVPPSTSVPARADAESSAWLRRLRAEGAEGDAALRELRSLLLRASHFEVRRRRGALPHASADELDDLAEQSADDALMAIMAKLDRFRGDSRFTTWAYKFALLEAAVKVRRRAWRGREVPVSEERWSVMADRRPTPAQDAETAELTRAVFTAIDDQLTAHQREVLVAITLHDVPIDVLAERMSTTRGALYKTLHDARAKLRAHLIAQGLRPDHARGDDPR